MPLSSMVVAAGVRKLPELSQSDRVESETTFSVGLGRSLHGAGGCVRDLAGDVQRLAMEVDVFPLQRTELAAPGTSHRRQSQEDRQAAIDRAGRRDEADDLVGAGQVDARPTRRWRGRPAEQGCRRSSPKRCPARVRGAAPSGCVAQSSPIAVDR